MKKQKRDINHEKIRKFQRDITADFIINGQIEFLFPKTFPKKYYTSLKDNYKAIGIIVVDKEWTMQGLMFEMYLKNEYDKILKNG